MMRFISIPLLLAFLFASTHSIVDHGTGGHKPSVWLPHGMSSHVQTRSQHSPLHAAHHHHDPAASHLHPADAHGADMHTHFTLASFPRAGSTLLPLLLALTGLIWAPDASAQVTFLGDDPFGHPPRSRPLYLHCRTLLI